MKVSRKIQPTHELRVPHLIFCIGEEAALFASSLMRKMQCNHRIVMVSGREQITAQCIKQHRAELQISRTIIVPVLLAENNTIYQIMYDYKNKDVKCLYCIVYKLAS